MISCAFERYIKDDYMMLWKFLSLTPTQQAGLNDRYYWLRWKFKGDDTALRKAVITMIENFNGGDGVVMTFGEIAKSLHLKEYQVVNAFHSGMKKIKRKMIALEYEYRDLENIGS